MNKKSTWRGHNLYYKDGKFFFEDDDTECQLHWKDRPCGYCQQYTTPEGHDACIANLPDVINACCGHGEINEAYIMFSDGRIFRKNEAIEWFKILGDKK